MARDGRRCCVRFKRLGISHVKLMTYGLEIFGCCQPALCSALLQNLLRLRLLHHHATYESILLAIQWGYQLSDPFSLLLWMRSV